MTCDVPGCGRTSKLRLCFRCERFYCNQHSGNHADQCLPPGEGERAQLLEAQRRRRLEDERLSRQMQHLGIVAPCLDKTLTVRVVDADTGRGVSFLDVSLVPSQQKPAWELAGVYAFDNLADGAVCIVKIACPAEYGKVVVRAAGTAGRGQQLEVQIRRFTLCFVLDADRDGEVDAPGTDFAAWSKGEGSTGAVVLFNNLNHGGRFAEGGAKLPIVNASDEELSLVELPYLAPLDIVSTGACSQAFVATLRADPPGKLRIFHEGVAVVGPKQEAWTIPIPEDARLHCYMEATCFPDVDFDGAVTLTLTLTTDLGQVLPLQRATVRVSPWIMHNALDELIAVYVVDIAAEQRMHTASYRAVAQYIEDLEAALGTGRVRRVDFSKYSFQPKADLFLRDVMSIGHCSLPWQGGAAWVPMVLGPVHDREGSYIHHFPSTLSGPQVGFHVPGGVTVKSDHTCNYFGNFLCSPPTDADPLGCIFYGTNETYQLDANLRRLLAGRTQRLEALDVGWLTIRHVDEVVCFVPSTRGGFAIVMPSPSLALALLGEAFENDPEAALFGGLFEVDAPMAGAAGLDSPRFAKALLENTSFVHAQGWVQKKLEALAKDIVEALGIGRHPVIRLPVLYDPPTDEFLPYYRALTPNVVNMLVGTNADGSAVLCIPKPYGPRVKNGECLFEREIARALGGTGNQMSFVRDFNMYHSSDGEVHCATNSWRRPRTGPWWTLG